VRILLIAPHFVGRWAESNQAALQSLGHSVRTIYYDRSPIESRAVRLAAMSAVWSRQDRDEIHAWFLHSLSALRHRFLVRMARNFSPNLVIVLKGDSIPMPVLEELRVYTRIPIVSWWVDDPFRFPESIHTYSFYDHFFVFDRAYIPRLKTAGVRRLTFLPCACDANTYRPMAVSAIDLRRYECDVAFVGWFYSERGKLVSAMAGLDVAVWGTGWQLPEAQQAVRSVGRKALRGRRLDSLRAARLYNIAKICVNSHHEQSVYNGLNMRSFELLACGAFELVDHLPGMCDLLLPGEEVVCYESPDHARELTDYYLARPEARAEIGLRGRERVLKEHTYKHRMESLLASVADLV